MAVRVDATSYTFSGEPWLALEATRDSSPEEKGDPE
jgi:hypothetical protein